MQGSVTANPIIMKDAVFRQRLGQSSTLSVLQRNSGIFNTGCASPTARCLFGSPSTKESKDLVREVELKNAITFGKRFNFDIINAEPFPSAKRMKLSHNSWDDSDEENVNVQKSHEEKAVDNSASEGFVWTEKYTAEHMEKCNKHAVNTSIVRPSRNPVPLLFAPIIMYSNHPSSSFSSPKSTSQESPEIPSSQPPKTDASPNSTSNNSSVLSTPTPLNEVSSSERNRGKRNNMSITLKKGSKSQPLTQAVRKRTVHAAKAGITRYFSIMRNRSSSKRASNNVN